MLSSIKTPLINVYMIQHSGDGPSACLPEMVPTPCSDHDDYPDCFPAKDICDSESQCPQGEDELLCNQRNYPSEF